MLGVFNKTNIFADADRERADDQCGVRHQHSGAVLVALVGGARRLGRQEPEGVRTAAADRQGGARVGSFRDAWTKTGNPVEALVWGDRKTCTEYAEGMVKLAQRYEKQLTARGKK